MNTGKYIVITSVDKNFLKIFGLWDIFFRRSDIDFKLHVACFDNESKNYLEKRGIEHSNINVRDYSSSLIWIHRLEIIRNFLKQGYSIIHSDLDAFWIHPEVKKIINPVYDMQMSIGHGLPKDIVKEWGFSLCCGFFILQSNDKMISFVEQWLIRAKDLMDDQIALNSMFHKIGLVWERTDDLYNYSYSEKYHIKIEAIAYQKIARIARLGDVDAGKVVVFHPYLGRDRSEEIKLLDAVYMIKDMKKKSFLNNLYFKTLIHTIIFRKYKERKELRKFIRRLNIIDYLKARFRSL